MEHSSTTSTTDKTRKRSALRRWAIDEELKRLAEERLMIRRALVLVRESIARREAELLLIRRQLKALKGVYSNESLPGKCDQNGTAGASSCVPPENTAHPCT
ncbi:uncharacterized protein LOC128998861 [Macrosteles quadrilineatus]|uniref:uncharacterized protein LOC128998861 n=1 Tax=Macrosteles quadrilineatus TaxID=74068 RepID=UPI0023E1C269|nr:uncharacterized protein LOC128998861 [Macrosteles quadrilineatus]